MPKKLRRTGNNPMPFTPSALLIAALCAVESNGNIYAIRGDAWGILQIRPAYVQDVNEYRQAQARKYKLRQTKFRHRDCLNRADSVQMFRDYMARYCTEELLGYPPTDMDAALIHRFGPTGARAPGVASVAYWMRVEATMEGMKAETVPEMKEVGP